MTKQMNQYELLLKSDDASPLPASPAASFNLKLAQWVQDNGAADDFIRTETAVQPALVHVVCTEAIARRIAETFTTIASVRMDKENVITLPDPLPKKTRRPGFETT